jgi:hypothetical protein
VNIDNIQERTDAEALYDEGMALYRRRRWREARQCFVRVKTLQPTRRGIEALLRELDIFIQLETVESEPSREPAIPAATPVDEPTYEQAPDAPTLQRRRGRSAIAVLVVFIVSALIVGGVYLARIDKLPFLGSEERTQRLFDRGTSLILTQRWDEALTVYASLAQSLPNDPEVLHGLTRAKEGLYAEAIESEQSADTADTLSEKLALLEKAAEKLRRIQAADPQFGDVNERLAHLNQLTQVVKLHDEARAFLANQAYGDAIRRLLDIRGYGIDYKPGTISDELYQAYMKRGERSVALAAEELVPATGARPEAPQYSVPMTLLAQIRRAATDFQEAQRERPQSAEARQAKALADGAHEGLERYNDWAWDQAIVALYAVYDAEPAYLDNKAGAVLCDALSHRIQIAHQSGDTEQTIAYLEMLGAVRECDAAPLAEIITALTPTATPTVTNTPLPTATSTPRPTFTPTPIPSPTDVPTATPVPTQPPSSGGSSGGGGSGGGSQPPPAPTRPPRN